MKIADWSCSLVEVPTHSRLDTSYGSAEAVRPHVIARLVDDSGRVGLGEASPLPFFTGETAASIKLQLEQLFLPALVGRDPRDHDEIMAVLDHLLPENRSAKCAVDMALYDLRGHVLGQPVYHQLGGLRRPDGFRVTRAIGLLSLEETVRMAEHWVERGFHTLKLKIGPDPDGDVERIRAVRRAVPSDVRLRIDANGGYDVPTAVRVLGALADAVEYCEQPIPPWDLAGLHQIRAATGVRITVDESVHTLRDLLRVVEARAADALVIKLIKCGGLRAAEHLAAVAGAVGMPVVVVSPFETHVGAAAGVHLALTLRPSPFAQELSIFTVEPRGPHTASAIQTNGDRILPPTAPGLGVTFE
ncbi:MAG: dipeptide epimerase [Chloroflexi bacterium]|nr:dipeptide epimerase [Chloroflexota bacterium]